MDTTPSSPKGTRRPQGLAFTGGSGATPRSQRHRDGPFRRSPGPTPTGAFKTPDPGT